MQNPTLRWGLQPAPGEYLAAWGARTYLSYGQLQLLHDRQDCIGSSAARLTLGQWIDHDALPALRKAIETDRHITEFNFSKHFFSMKAKEYHGYIMINATLEGSEIPPEGKWSADFPIPKIGDQVHINFNGLGDGRVLGYFREGGDDQYWIGVIVHLFNQPDWHRRQNGNAAIATVFGAEITTGAGEQTP